MLEPRVTCKIVQVIFVQFVIDYRTNFSLFNFQILWEGDNSRGSAQAHDEGAWIFRKWYEIDVKYPFVKEFHYLRCILIVLL